MLNMVLPNNIEAESSVLCTCLIDPDVILKVIPILKHDDFYLEKHGWIYEAIGAIYGRHEPVDFVTVCSELERRGILNDVGGSAYITHLVNQTAMSFNAKTYAELVKKSAIERELVRAAGKIAEIGYGGQFDANIAVAKSQEIISKIKVGTRSRFTSANEVGMSMETSIIEGFENPGMIRGIPTGYKSVDRILRGLRPGDNLVVAGRPGMGKSAFSCGIAVNAALEEKKVAYFSLEMSREQMQMRTACYLGNFDSKEVESGYRRKTNEQGYWDGKTYRRWTNEEQAEFLACWVRAEALPILWNDAGGITTTEAYASMTELISDQGADLVVFDYIGLAGDDGNSTYEQISRVSKNLKNIYRTLGIPGITVAQLNRDCEKRNDKRPQLADLRDSGGVEQDADAVVLIYRAKQYWKTEQEWKAQFPRLEYPNDRAELLIEKNRRGETGHAFMIWKPEYTKFFDEANP